MSPHQRNAILRQYRSYLPDSRWLPEAPVFVWLTGPGGKSMPRHLARELDDYELSLLSGPKQQQRFKKLLAAAAAVAAVIMPMSAQSASADPAPERPSVPPSVQQSPVHAGPPTASLNSAARREAHGLQPLLDSRGRPVELGAFHSNVVTPHSNTLTFHTNNALIPHSNVWLNHSNVPSYTIPHTNVVPGDFIF